jgi:hypothetical protein
MRANSPRASRRPAVRGVPRRRAAAGLLVRRRATATRGRVAVCLLLLSLLASGLAACGSGGGSGNDSATAPLSTPLATSLPSAGGSWALLPAGASSGEEHFWELLHRGAGSTHWTLVTPPGVQDNGGLAIAAAGGTLLAGFLPSYNLHFSPLALTTDGGATWTPALLPSALASVPDSLALSSSGPDYALLAKGGGEIVQSNTPGSGEWRALTAARALATLPVAHGCGLVSIDAIASTSPEGVLAGGACTQAGQIGEYAYAHGSWRAAAPPTPAALRDDSSRVVLLASTGATTLTLVDFLSTSQNTLLAAWSTDGGHHWAESPPLVMGAREDLIAAGPAPRDRTFLLVSTPHGNRLRIGAPATPWRATPHPPASTATVALSDTGEIDALAVHVYTIVEWRLAGTSGAWHRVGTLPVTVSAASH